MQTYASIGSRTQAFADTNHLKHAIHMEILAQFGVVKQMPQNKTLTIKMRRPNPYGEAAVLTEGVAPTPTTHAYTDVTGVLAQIGGFVEITDVVADTHEDPVLADITMLNGEQCGLTKEKRIWREISTTAAKDYAGGHTAIADVAAGDVITLADQRRQTKMLKRNKGTKITSKLSGSNNYKTEPVAASYIGVGHTDLETNIRNMAGFTPVELYASGKEYEGEIGKVEDVRYLLSAEFEAQSAAGALGIDVFHLVYFCKDSYGTVALRGKGSCETLVRNPGKPEKGDELGQTGSIGWKAWTLETVLNTAWIRSVACAAE